MTLAHVVGVRNGLADYTVDQIDVGSTDAQGDLIFMAAGDTEVATLLCSNPAFLAAASGTAAADTITSDSSATGGTIAAFKFQNRNNSEVFRGSVTATGGGGDIEMTSLVIGATDTVALASFSYTASA